MNAKHLTCACDGEKKERSMQRRGERKEGKREKKLRKGR